MSEAINTLNQITSIVDEKATIFREEWSKMPKVRAVTERKLILDLIETALQAAATIHPSPVDLVRDLKRLSDELRRLPV
ncbi:hypothetical protein LEP1GSC050_0776 [Leptospira broomii serovar Hurstbridge str. 5399]|uniref:Uncharacterized protein n=1 Tax=Leptospira broomii serovar Hurstbridge str. 5399 TaxID=1049789 RepID=T0F7Z2_9LEPT|nr:hypothetical protein [Leptospira broomii]EQA47255.1 hypothetical protein LEP1GSC050_0776 [Leptospira broomii serovar Hurstbridge str. 5399]